MKDVGLPIFNHDKCLIIESMYTYDNGGIESGGAHFIFVFFHELLEGFDVYEPKMLKVEIKNNFYKHGINSEIYSYLDEYDEDEYKKSNYELLINQLLSSPSFKKRNKKGIMLEISPNKNRFLSIAVFDKSKLPKNLFKGIMDDKTINVLKNRVPKKLVIYDTKDVIENVLEIAPYFSQQYFEDNFMFDSFKDVDVKRYQVWNGVKFQPFSKNKSI